MSRSKEKRTYNSRARREAAEGTRRSILDAALKLFVETGYAGATMPEIARRAGVALDTVYATVGKKPALFRLLLETALSGADVAVPAEEREYVRAIKAEPDARRKLEIYARAITEINARLAPLFRVLQEAATSDEDLGALWKQISERRAKNMRLFAADLASTGRLRSGLSEETVADVIWSMNAPEYFLLLVNERGWSPEKFRNWIADAWARMFLQGD